MIAVHNTNYYIVVDSHCNSQLQPTTYTSAGHITNEGDESQGARLMSTFGSAEMCGLFGLIKAIILTSMGSLNEAFNLQQCSSITNIADNFTNTKHGFNSHVSHVTVWDGKQLLSLWLSVFC